MKILVFVKHNWPKRKRTTQLFFFQPLRDKPEMFVVLFIDTDYVKLLMSNDHVVLNVLYCVK